MENKSILQNFIPYQVRIWLVYILMFCLIPYRSEVTINETPIDCKTSLETTSEVTCGDVVNVATPETTSNEIDKEFTPESSSPQEDIGSVKTTDSQLESG